MNLDDQNKSVQYLLRNTYNNVKIYPTTVLNNKIIYQENKKIETEHKKLLELFKLLCIFGFKYTSSFCFHYFYHQ